MPASARIWTGAGLVAVGFLIAWSWQGSRWGRAYGKAMAEVSV